MERGEAREMYHRCSNGFASYSLTSHLWLITRAGRLGVSSHSEAGDGDFLLVGTLLAVDGLALRADHIGSLEGTLLFRAL